ncbi:MAG TPA: YraN family protein [Caldilineaceae bacterium]|nr:YraN family protein [Caldilineaceae bacterium]
MDGRRGLGRRGELLAAEALTQAGLTVIARNWRCPAGELDLIAQELAPDLLHGGAVTPWLVIVEVRTRRGRAFGSARESVTPRKQAKLRELGAAYVQAVGWTGPWRIDVVAVQMDTAGRLQAVEHIRHAVTG